MTFESSIVLFKRKSKQVTELQWIWLNYPHVHQRTITLVSAAPLRNVAVCVIHCVDLRRFGRHCFKCICFAVGDEVERVSGLYANVHTHVLTADTLLVLVLIPWPLAMISLDLCHPYSSL